MMRMNMSMSMSMRNKDILEEMCPLCPHYTLEYEDEDGKGEPQHAPWCENHPPPILGPPPACKGDPDIIPPREGGA